MYVLNYNITINTRDAKTIAYAVVSDVVVDTSIRQLTDTATVTVPRKLEYKGKDITQFIKTGDEITIELGYDDRLKTIFKGFLKRVKTGIPVVLECENEAYVRCNLKYPPDMPKKMTIAELTEVFQKLIYVRSRRSRYEAEE